MDHHPPDAKNDSPQGPRVKLGVYQMLVAGEVMRSKFRNSIEKPERMVPGRKWQPANPVFAGSSPGLQAF